MGRLQRPFGNLSVIILKKKMGLRPILILQGFKNFLTDDTDTLRKIDRLIQGNSMIDFISDVEKLPDE